MSEKQIQRFDKYGKLGAYHWKMLDDAPDYRKRVEFLMSLVQPGADCLDLGCGDGACIARMATLCRHVVGVDADADGVRLARQHLAAAGIANATIVHAPFHEAAVELARWKHRFRLVYAMDVIEHLYEPADLLDLVEEMLAPDGLAVIGTPLFVAEEAVSSYHVKEFTVEEVEALLLPRFERVDEAWLDACFPNVRGWSPRFYTFVGRVRARPRPAEERDRPEVSSRRSLREDLFTRCYRSLLRIAELEREIDRLRGAPPDRG